VAASNAPYSNTRSVVELAIGEIISSARRLLDRDRALHAGTWDKSATGSHEIRGRTLGIVGYGNIGSQLSVLAEALGMRVLFYDWRTSSRSATPRPAAAWRNCSSAPRR
jgi:D-3-phosphoglycerate dehydrogenase